MLVYIQIGLYKLITSLKINALISEIYTWFDHDKNVLLRSISW